MSTGLPGFAETTDFHLLPFGDGLACDLDDLVAGLHLPRFRPGCPAVRTLVVGTGCPPIISAPKKSTDANR